MVWLCNWTIVNVQSWQVDRLGQRPKSVSQKNGGRNRSGPKSKCGTALLRASCLKLETRVYMNLWNEILHTPCGMFFYEKLWPLWPLVSNGIGTRIRSVECLTFPILVEKPCDSTSSIELWISIIATMDSNILGTFVSGDCMTPILKIDVANIIFMMGGALIQPMQGKGRNFVWNR